MIFVDVTGSCFPDRDRRTFVANQPLTSQFTEAQRRIHLTERAEIAKAAHLEVRSVLAEDVALQEHGLDDVLIGSYARNTAIWPGKDVDVFGRLTSETIDSISPGDAYEMFAEALEPFGERVRRQPRSLLVDFGPQPGLPEERFLEAVNASQRVIEAVRKGLTRVDFSFSVDVVPAVKWNDDYGIPERDRDRWVTASVDERWRRTNPVRLNELTTVRNEQLLVGSTGAFVPTVKALKQLKSHHLEGVKPSSLFYSFVLHEGLTRGEITGDSWADVTASAIGYVAHRLPSIWDDRVCDPALGEPYEPLPDESDHQQAREAFEQCAQTAQEAVTTSDRCRAAYLWRSVLGSNGFEEHSSVFPLPSGCREDGTAMAGAVATNPLTGGSKERGFGEQ